LNYFSLNPNEYYRAKTGTDLVRQGISLLPVMLFLFQDFFISFSLIGVKLACMMLGNIYFLNQYKKKRKLGNVNIRLLVFLSAALLLYVGVYFDLIPKFYPSNQTAIVVSIISLVIVAIGWSYVVHYRNFKEISVQFAGKNVIALKVSVSTALNEDDTGLKSLDWSENKEFWERNKNRKPANYIEHTFNDRFRKPIGSFTKQTIIRNLVILLLQEY